MDWCVLFYRNNMIITGTSEETDFVHIFHDYLSKSEKYEYITVST